MVEALAKSTSRVKDFRRGATMAMKDDTMEDDGGDAKGKGLGKVEAKGKRKGKCFWSGSGASGAMRLGHNG
ncbi:hypothetical protein GYH30_016183 [Glycine max]|nr:hypothetical protein GYH30_016183 [Glycine max]